MRIKLSCLFISFFSFLNFAQNFEDSLRAELMEFNSFKMLPGFAVAIVHPDGILFQDAMGFSDLALQKPYTLKTIQSVASVSKTTIAISLMQLVEKGKLSLDAPINDFLPYKVHNPKFKDSVIRVRHLVTHTSGIIDTENNYDWRSRYFIKQTTLENSKLDTEYLDFIKVLEKNKKLSLKQFCKNVFSDKGVWYESSTFTTFPPGKCYSYSNVGSILMAHIVEKASGLSFDKYASKNIFQKLEMKETNFSIEKVDPELLATSYISEDFIATPYFGDNAYPDGGMQTNCDELSKYLIEILRGLEGNGSLINLESYRQMMLPSLDSSVIISNETGKNFADIGVFWHLATNKQLFHNGGNPFGGTVYMWIDPKTKIGRILMTNCDVKASRETVMEFLGIWRSLEKYAVLLAEEK